MRCLSVQLIGCEVFAQRKICGLQHMLQQPILERQYCHLHPTINVSICYARTSLVFPRKLTPLPVMVRNNNIVLLGWPWLGMGCDLLTVFSGGTTKHVVATWNGHHLPYLIVCYILARHIIGIVDGFKVQDLSKVLNDIKTFPRCSTTSRLLVQISKAQGWG